MSSVGNGLPIICHKRKKIARGRGKLGAFTVEKSAQDLPNNVLKSSGALKELLAYGLFPGVRRTSPCL